MVLGITETPQSIQPIAIAIGHPSQHKGKSLMLKTSHTLVIGHKSNQTHKNKTQGEIDLEAPSPLNWLADIVLKEAMQISRGEKLPGTLPSCEPCELPE